MPRGWTRALALLLLMPCFGAAYDAVLLATSWQRLHRAAASLGDGIAAAAAPGQADFGAWFAYAQTLAQPDDVSRRGAVVVSAIRRGPDGSVVLWQRHTGGDVASRFGPPGTRAPGGAAPGTLIGTELFAPISPWVLGTGWLRRLLPNLLPELLQASALRRAA